MAALRELVVAGKVRHLGGSSMWAWQFAKMQTAARLHGWTPFAAMQNQYNLLKREEEREMLPMCADMGVGVVPYSPQGKGRLTRPWGQQTARASVDEVAKAFDSPADQPIIEATEAVARDRGVPMAQVALAWVLSKPVVTAPIVGATKPHHLTDAVAALDLTLTPDEIQRLEAPYVPQAPYWW
jgi:1-deoxyxylulose-5-phosphate synthase